jgi:hypothetical protein
MANNTHQSLGKTEKNSERLHVMYDVPRQIESTEMADTRHAEILERYYNSDR